MHILMHSNQKIRLPNAVQRKMLSITLKQHCLNRRRKRIKKAAPCAAKNQPIRERIISVMLAAQSGFM